MDGKEDENDEEDMDEPILVNEGIICGATDVVAAIVVVVVVVIFVGADAAGNDDDGVDQGKGGS